MLSIAARSAKTVCRRPQLFQPTRFASGSTTASPYSKPFFEKNALLNRPMSPHLTIYKLQLTSMLSITHRGTGIFLSLATSAGAIFMLTSSEPLQHYVDKIKEMKLPAVVPFAAKFLIAWPIAFHTANGIRHLNWDLARGLQIPQVYRSGYVVLAVSAIAGLILAAQ
eukprot:Opistho-2@28874